MRDRTPLVDVFTEFMAVPHGPQMQHLLRLVEATLDELAVRDRRIETLETKIARMEHDVDRLGHDVDRLGRSERVVIG